ncbi:MAG: VCBS repeat-containing protein, partial [Phycisphaerae bacterium]
YVGTMSGDEPAAFFWNDRGRFTLMRQHPAAVRARATGSVFVDLDNDGLLELYVSNHGGKHDESVRGVPNLLLRARPDRKLERVTDSGATPHVTGRGVGVLDYDGDGLLDLFVTTRPRTGQRSWLLRNVGNLKFVEASEAAGLPTNIHGLGVAVADLTGNGWPDFIVGGSNRVFLNRGNGTYREATELRSLLDWNYTREDHTDSCGVCFGDVNRDGRPDLAIGFHTKWPWSKDPRPVRLFLNRGCTVDKARFQEVTREAGLENIWMKAPHVELRDFDNDGWADLLTSVMVYSADGHHPLIYRNQGTTPGGVPKFRQTALTHQPDFPTRQDRTISNRAFYDNVSRDLRVL